MFKFFKNKRYYYKTWTGETLEREVLIRGEIHKVKVYPYQIKRRAGWLDVEDQYMEYFIKFADINEGYHIDADCCTTALMKFTRHVEMGGDYVY